MIYNLIYKYDSLNLALALALGVDIYDDSGKLVRTEEFFISAENMAELIMMETRQNQQNFLIQLLRSDYSRSDTRSYELHYNPMRNLDDLPTQITTMPTFNHEHKSIADLSPSIDRLYFPIRSCVGVTYDNEKNANLSKLENAKASIQTPYLFF